MSPTNPASPTSADANDTAQQADHEQPMVFEVVINGTIEQVWNELTKTDGVQKAMFNAQLHTTALGPGAQIRMRTPDGKYTVVAGEVIDFKPRVRFSHTFRFTQFDDPPCEVIYDLEQTAEGVRFRLTVDRAPTGTATAKNMRRGGTMICQTLKSMIETGKPPLATRLMYVLFGLLTPLTPKRCLSTEWPLTP